MFVRRAVLLFLIFAVVFTVAPKKAKDDKDKEVKPCDVSKSGVCGEQIGGLYCRPGMFCDQYGMCSKDNKVDMGRNKQYAGDNCVKGEVKTKKPVKRRLMGERENKKCVNC